MSNKLSEVESSLEKRMLKVSSVTWLSTAFSMGTQLISVPICLRFWGKDTYGVWLSIMAAYVMLRTVDGGYVGYVGNKINMLYHKDDGGMRLTLSSAIYGVIFLGILQLLVLITLYISNSMSFIMDSQTVHAASHDVFIALLVLSLSWVLTGSYIGIIHRLQIPSGMMYQAAWWSMVFQIAQFVSLITAAILRFNVLQAALMFSLVQALIYITSAVYIKIKLPCYYPWWSGLDMKTGITNVIKSIPITLGGILQQCGNSALIMLVAAFLGTAAVPAYTTVRTLSNLWTTMINVFTSPLLPDVVRFHALGNWKKLLVVQQTHLILIGTVINLSVIVAYPLLNDFFALWTRHRLVLDRPLLSLLLATVPLLGMGALINTFLSGINHYWFIISYSILRGILVLLLSWILIPFYGTTGLGIAIFSTEILVFLVSLLWFYQFIGKLTSIIESASWCWVSSGCLIVYLLLASFGIKLGMASYVLTMLGVIISSVLGWVALDREIKNRIKYLLYIRK